MARYELSDGKSSKFWTVSVHGTVYRVRYGKIGSRGRATSKRLGSERAAKAEADRLAAEKVKKGYTLVNADEVVELTEFDGVME